MTSFSIGRTIEVGELRVTVLERTSLDHQKKEQGILLLARKEPFAVLVRKADVAYGMGMDGAPVSISHLVEEIPEVEPLISVIGAQKGHRTSVQLGLAEQPRWMTPDRSI